MSGEGGGWYMGGPGRKGCVGALSWSPCSSSPLLSPLCAVAMVATVAMEAMVRRGEGGTHAATMLPDPVGGALEAAPAVAQVVVVGPVPVPPQVCVPYWDK